MKKELDYFMVGSSYGGNQDWFRTFMMRIGGCAAETACDSSLYFAIYKEIEGVYPFDCRKLSREDYVEFAHMMEKYLWPRMSGIHKLSTYVEGYSKYLQDRGISRIAMDTLDGNAPYELASKAVRKQIDDGCPVPILILRHRDRDFEDYVWHWFLINGYDDAEDSMMVKAVTYSSYQWVNFRKLWDTGHQNKGGLILYKIMAG